ncbi:MAG: glycosyltransferase [Microgenomates group bacterium]
MRVALVYDRVNKWGGAERVLLALHEIWPEAPLFTAVYNPKKAQWAKVFQVFPSFLNKFPLGKTYHELYPWLMPLAFESFNFDNFEVVISVTSEAAKGIITKPSTLHICYCLTPTRYLWSGYDDYFKNKMLRLITKPIVNYLRKWDKIASWRPDCYVAISQNIQQRIKKYYCQDSELIYPPIDTEFFKLKAKSSKRKTEKKNTKYFLIVSRLVPYKKIDIAVKAFNDLGLPLKIIGIGKQMGKLKRMANKNIEFLGQLTDEKLLSYYQNCLAVIFPQEEDFGLVPLEAQACGKPVIAFRGGGAKETIIENKTGIFFDHQTPESLITAIKKFKKMKFKVEDCQQNALRFSKERFKKEFKDLVIRKWQEKMI